MCIHTLIYIPWGRVEREEAAIPAGATACALNGDGSALRKEGGKGDNKSINSWGERKKIYISKEIEKDRKKERDREMGLLKTRVNTSGGLVTGAATLFWVCGFDCASSSSTRNRTPSPLFKGVLMSAKLSCEECNFFGVDCASRAEVLVRSTELEVATEPPSSETRGISLIITAVSRAEEAGRISE